MPTAIIIDDSPIMRSQLRRVLAEAGLTVVAEAATADHLVTLYEQHHPSLITLDIVMPGRDGADAASELLAAHPDAVVVVCSSVATQEKMLACQRAGVSYYLHKPFDPERAAAIFRCVVERPRRRSVAR